MELRIRNLSKTYGKTVKALDNINLTIGKGMFGLLGENGAGKSTLMKIITTLMDADEGDVVYDGSNIKNDPMKLRRELGYLPQEFGVYPAVNALEFLDYIAELKGISKKSERESQVETLLKKANLWDDRKRKLGEYSGGMKQRMGIAQALIGNPRLIIVDEPTAGLDPMERNRFYNLLSEIGENTIVILSTHIVEDVSVLCHQMAILGHGQLLAVGTPAELAKEIEGRIWRKEIAKHEYEEYASKYDILSNHFQTGKLLITTVQDSNPKNGFTAKQPTLEDTYFYILKNRKAA